MIENFQSCILMLLAKVFGHLAAPNDDAWAEFSEILIKEGKIIAIHVL